MTKDYIGYQALTDAALRSVVRDAIRRVEEQGLIGSHHFYLTFKTQFPGVDIPDFLREQYPDEMTVILQHQFWGLKVTDERFEVTLSFRKVPATLSIPFAAMTAFFDPGVQFGLQFRGSEDQEGSTALPRQMNAPVSGDPKEGEKSADASAGEAPPTAAAGEVVSLDSFRKK
ncbi:MAG TPA: ClpXP protease specificity-enhancing factor SspB [Rhizomicrobium sp.]|nr:ClpXP protease specificity-enhancing factor SspB [Rhizomicrobium sp.]